MRERVLAVVQADNEDDAICKAMHVRDHHFEQIVKQYSKVNDPKPSFWKWISDQYWDFGEEEDATFYLKEMSMEYM